MELIPIIKPYLGKEELDKVSECFRDNWITGGSKLIAFEKRIAELTNAKYAIACSNGTMALYMGLVAMGIKPGDEVIVPDFTFIASANAVILAGAKPVFCDIHTDTFNINCAECENLISNKTKAIMPVHIYGMAADMRSILNLAIDHNLWVIEDAAQGIGVSYAGFPVGALGDVGTLSFYCDKTITTGEGGMVLTNNTEIADKALMLKHQGRRKRGVYLHESIGYNFRMTDMQAAIGLAQLDKLDFIIKRKKAMEKRYRDNLKDVVNLPKVLASSVPFRINILADNPQKMSEHLASKGIQTMRFFYPLHKQPCYSYMELSDKRFANSIWAYEHGLSLPSWVGLTEEQIDYICEVIHDYFR